MTRKKVLVSATAGSALSLSGRLFSFHFFSFSPLSVSSSVLLPLPPTSPLSPPSSFSSPRKTQTLLQNGAPELAGARHVTAPFQSQRRLRQSGVSLAGRQRQLLPWQERRAQSRRHSLKGVKVSGWGPPSHLSPGLRERTHGCVRGKRAMFLGTFKIDKPELYVSSQSLRVPT